MGAVNSCCIPHKSGIDDDGRSSFRSRRGLKGPRRQLSATFNMTMNEEAEEEALVKNRLDINTATEEELMTLPGINRMTAKLIVEYRKQIRGFKCIEDIALVSGVGAAKLQQLQNEICVKRLNGMNGYVKSGNGSDTPSSEPNHRKEPRLVNLNTSNVFQLMKVKGIGQVLAENIVTYRDKKGPFTKIDDLVKVKGIGPHILSAIKPQLTLEDVPVSDNVSYSSSKKSGNNSAIPSRNSDLSMSGDVQSNLSINDFSKTSMEHLIDRLGPFAEKSVRPSVELPKFKCNNRHALKIASWNLECFSSEKADNLGVKEVVCMTILENGISLLAVQELADKQALQKICDELNSPTLPNVQKWSGHHGKWQCTVSEATGRMYKSNEFNGFLYDQSQGVHIISSCLLEYDKKKKPFTRKPFIGTFKMKRFDCAVVSVHLKATGLDNEDLGRLQQELDQIPEMVEAIHQHLTDEKDIIILGDFNMGPEVKDFDSLRKLGYKNCIASDVFTNISDANAKGSKCYDNIWISAQTSQVYTGNNDVVRTGLSSPWIPKGWTWGGVVSDHCPIWVQVYTGKDLDTGELTIGPEAIKFAVGNE